MTKLEQIEKLREKAAVSYDEAKTALELNNDDLLDAIIYLEKQGKVIPPSGGGCYSSVGSDEIGNADRSEEQKYSTGRDTFSESINRIGKFCVQLIDRGNASSLEVLKDDVSKGKLPLTVVALLLIFLPWVSLPLLVVGLVLGCRYRLNGVNIGEEE